MNVAKEAQTAENTEAAAPAPDFIGGRRRQVLTKRFEAVPSRHGQQDEDAGRIKREVGLISKRRRNP